MIKSNITFIGGGNMAYAIAKNMIAAKLSEPGSITVSDTSKDRLKFLSKELGIKTTSDNTGAVESADIIILAIKPQVFRKEYQSFAESMEDKCVVSIMAGVPLDELEEALPDSTRILRTMPNMPAMVGEGMTAFCSRHKLKNNEIDLAEKIFSSVGKIFYVDEHLIDAVIGITGSGPAYVFMFMEALADAGVLHGLPRELAYELSAQLLKGSAVSVQETGLHPAELKDRVCSPGGTTIEAVKSLEKSGFRGIVIEAVDQCVKKAKRMQDDRN